MSLSLHVSPPPPAWLRERERRQDGHEGRPPCPWLALWCPEDTVVCDPSVAEPGLVEAAPRMLDVGTHVCHPPTLHRPAPRAQFTLRLVHRGWQWSRPQPWETAPPFPPTVSISLFFLCVHCCPANVHPYHLYILCSALIYDICFSLSDWTAAKASDLFPATFPLHFLLLSLLKTLQGSPSLLRMQFPVFTIA